MSDADEALLWARVEYAALLRPFDVGPQQDYISEAILNGLWDDDVAIRHSANGYRAGAAASAERIKALEGAIRSLIAIIDSNGVLHDPVYPPLGLPKRHDGQPVVDRVKQARRAVNEARALLKEPGQ